MTILLYIIDIVSVALICVGLVFFLGAAVGIVRFPDFYTRMHAASKGDTLSTLLILSGFALQLFHNFQSLDLLVMAKILAICALIMLTSPTSTHALINAGYEDGIKPMLGEGQENPLPDPVKPLVVKREQSDTGGEA